MTETVWIDHRKEKTFLERCESMGIKVIETRINLVDYTYRHDDYSVINKVKLRRSQLKYLLSFLSV